MTEAFSPEERSPWADAMLVASIFAVDPTALGGIAVKASVGPVRDRWMALLRDLLPAAAPFRRVPLAISDSRLLGGLDLTATLEAGRPVAERGILAEADGGVVVLAMAERLEAGAAARIAAVLDSGQILIERDGLGLRVPSRFGVIALDEGIGDDEAPPAAILDRLGFHLDLDSIGVRDIDDGGPERVAIDAARSRLPSVTIGEPMLQAICATALALGVDSLRPSILAIRAARVIAALAGSEEVRSQDATLAAQLVLAPRATRIPTPEPEAATSEQQDQPPDPTPPDQDRQAQHQDSSEPEEGDAEQKIDDLVLAAAQASIPADLLARLRIGGFNRARAKSSGKKGMLQQAKRGRPIGVRKGELNGGARLNLIETLRAAAPWQRIRRAERPASVGMAQRIQVRRDDFRVARLKQRSETTTIFVVDASGSSALNRLAEAKGAVELLLAECYVRRDKVALIAFRGQGAELLLPPTRSLVRAKRCLGNLPGGGGTPLAAGIDAATALAEGVRRQGATPVVIVMTDGRANVGRGGKLGRAQAEADARSAAVAARAAGVTAMLVDTSPRAQPAAGRLAADMGAFYLPLPSADAASLSRQVSAVVQSPGSRSQVAR
jgi:magnesium chelatase subunit D